MKLRQKYLFNLSPLTSTNNLSLIVLNSPMKSKLRILKLKKFLKNLSFTKIKTKKKASLTFYNHLLLLKALDRGWFTTWFNYSFWKKQTKFLRFRFLAPNYKQAKKLIRQLKLKFPKIFLKQQKQFLYPYIKKNNWYTKRVLKFLQQKLSFSNFQKYSLITAYTITRAKKKTSQILLKTTKSKKRKKNLVKKAKFQIFNKKKFNKQFKKKKNSLKVYLKLYRLNNYFRDYKQRIKLGRHIIRGGYIRWKAPARNSIFWKLFIKKEILQRKQKKKKHLKFRWFWKTSKSLFKKYQNNVFSFLVTKSIKKKRQPSLQKQAFIVPYKKYYQRVYFGKKLKAYKYLSHKPHAFKPFYYLTKAINKRLADRYNLPLLINKFSYQQILIMLMSKYNIHKSLNRLCKYTKLRETVPERRVILNKKKPKRALYSFPISFKTLNQVFLKRYLRGALFLSSQNLKMTHYCKQFFFKSIIKKPLFLLRPIQFKKKQTPLQKLHQEFYFTYLKNLNLRENYSSWKLNPQFLRKKLSPKQVKANLYAFNVLLKTLIANSVVQLALFKNKVSPIFFGYKIIQQFQKIATARKRLRSQTWPWQRKWRGLSCVILPQRYHKKNSRRSRRSVFKIKILLARLFYWLYRLKNLSYYWGRLLRQQAVAFEGQPLTVILKKKIKVLY